MYYLKKFSRHFLYNSIILCDYYYFFIVNNFSMFNIVSIIIFGLIVFFMNTSLPFLNISSIYFSMCLQTSSYLLYGVCMVEIKGVEPLTSCLQGRRSSQLSYIPI